MLDIIGALRLGGVRKNARYYTRVLSEIFYNSGVKSRLDIIDAFRGRVRKNARYYTRVLSEIMGKSRKCALYYKSRFERKVDPTIL